MLLKFEVLKTKCVTAVVHEGTDEEATLLVEPIHAYVSKEAYVFNHKAEKLKKLDIIKVVKKSERPEEYARYNDNNCLVKRTSEKIGAIEVAEFVINNDNYIIWFGKGKKWLIGIGGSDADGVVSYESWGTKEQIKQVLVNFAIQDRENAADEDYDAWEHGTECIEDIHERPNGELYAYNAYSNSHVDYSAIPEMNVEFIDVNDVA